MKKEIFYNFILTILANVILFIQNKYFIKYMGIELFGMMKLFTQLLACLNIIEMGLGSASAFSLYTPLSKKDYNQISIIVNTIEQIYNKIAVLLLGLGILCTPFLSYFIKISDFSKIIYLYWILYVINTVSTYLFIKYIILFTANQEFIYVKYNQTKILFVTQIGQLFSLAVYRSFSLYIVLSIMGNLLQWFFFKRHYNKKYSFIFKTNEKYKQIKKDIKNLFWHKLGGLIVFNTDLVLISKLTSLETVGIYANYQMIIQILNTLISIITSVVSPKIGKFISQNDIKNTYKYFKVFNITYLFIALFFTNGMFYLVNNFIKLWLQEELFLKNTTLILISINLLILLFRGNLETFKTGSGFFDDINSPILESIINLISSIFLGLKLGLDGVIMGTIVSNVTVILMYKPILVFKRCFNKDWREYLKVYGNYLILVLLSIGSLNILIKPFINNNINTWFSWILYAIKISSISFITIFIIFLLNKDFRLLLKKNKE